MAGTSKGITLASSTGQEATEAGFLDTHFEACRHAYEAMVRSVGIESGWHMLDAACGSGSFLPLLAELVGPGGSLAAFDLAPDNVAHAQRLVAGSSTTCPVDVRQASLTALPYPDDAFDAVWCANSLQYLTEAELRIALAEFRRVVRPGGLVAIKEVDLGLMLFAPADRALLWHLLDAGRETERVKGLLRGREMHVWLARAGLVDVWQRATTDEHHAPLQLLEQEYIGSLLTYFAGLAERYGVPEGDLPFWHAQRDPASPQHLIHHPEFYYCEGTYIAVGRVPEESGQQA